MGRSKARRNHASRATGRSKSAAGTGSATASAIKNSGTARLRGDGWLAPCGSDLVPLERARDCNGEPAEGAKAKGADEKSQSRADHRRERLPAESAVDSRNSPP